MERWIRRILLVITAMAALTVGASALSAEEAEALFTYTAYDYKGVPAAEVESYVGSPEGSAALDTVQIPDVLADGRIVRSIGDNAFDAVTSPTNNMVSELKTIVLPNSIVHIGQNAFTGAENLNTIEIPGGVAIDQYAFQNCKNLRKVTPLDALDENGELSFVETSIGEGAFSGCRNLVDLTLPGNLESISDSAFSGCTELTKLIVPFSVSEIGSQAFGGCRSLENVIFLRRDVTIDSNAFEWGDVELFHCVKGSPTYEFIYGQIEWGIYQDENEILSHIHGFTASNEDLTGTITGLSDPRCSDYGKDGKVTVKFVCEGTKKIERKTEWVEDPTNPKTDPTTGEIILGPDGKPVFNLTNKEVVTETTIPCKSFNNGSSFTQIRDISAPYHNMEDRADTEATCTEPAYKGGKACSICGAVLVDPTADGDPLGHEYAKDPEDSTKDRIEEEIVQEPTCSEEGITERFKTCIRPVGDDGGTCGHVELIERDEHVPRTPHEFGYGHMGKPETLKEATCTEAGLVVTHSICKVCGFSEADECGWCAKFEEAIEERKDSVTLPDGSTILNENTGTAGQSLAGAALPAPYAEDGDEGDGGDEEKPDPYDDLTKIEQGYVDHLRAYHGKDAQKFDGDEKIYWKAEVTVTAKTGHKQPDVVEMEVKTPPDCEHEGVGVIGAYRCEVCKEWIGEQEEVPIPATGHKWVYDPKLDEILEPATCTDGGLKNTYEVCVNENCPLEGKPRLLKEDVPIDPDPQGHKWKDFVKDEGSEKWEFPCKPGTATGTATCAVCGVKEALTIDLEPKQDHTWGGWTASEDGKKESRSCTVCGETQERDAAVPPEPEDPEDPEDPDKPEEPDKPDPNASYTITVVQGAGGTIKVSHTSAKAGTSVSVTVTPDAGYELDMIRVIGSTTAQDLTGRRPSFTMPASNVRVQASFARIADEAGWGGIVSSERSDPTRTEDTVPVQITSPAGAPRADAWTQLFSDVPTSHWAAGEINWANQMGYMGGAGGRFDPDRGITGQQVWMVMARLMGTYPASLAEARRWAVETGFATGSDPERAMSRHEVVTALYRCAVLKGRGTRPSGLNLAGYTDSSLVPAVARDAMIWAVANGIVAGDASNRLDPTGTVTRAQFAVLLYRFSQRV